MVQLAPKLLTVDEFITQYGDNERYDEQELAESPAYDPYRENNEKRGIKTILVVPLLFGETFLGYTFLRNKQRRDYKLEELELARALAHQATLAIQLTRLAQQAKEAAVLEERNRMAREIHDTLAQGCDLILVLWSNTSFLATIQLLATACNSPVSPHS